MNRTVLALAIFCAVALGVSAFAGTAPMSAGDTLAALFGQGSDAARIIVWEIRLPRSAAAFFVGASLGLAWTRHVGPVAFRGLAGVHP